MSDQSIRTIPAFTGPSSLTSTRVMKAGAPAAGGKIESSTGNPLPLEDGSAKHDLETVTRSLAQLSISIGHDLRFIVDLKGTQPIIQVLDSETGEVIRQIPSDQFSIYATKSSADGIRLLDTVA